MLRILKAAIIALSINSCAVAYPTGDNDKSIAVKKGHDYVEVCDSIEVMSKALSLAKLNPIFISGSATGYATIVYINLKTEESAILRVNNGIGCIVSDGIQMILKFPQGIQEI
jgi:hypothetical protein